MFRVWFKVYMIMIKCLGSLLIIFLTCSCSFLKDITNFHSVHSDLVIKQDTIRKTLKIRPYKEIITAKAISEKGIFDVHMVDDKYYFQIPDTLLGRDILLVNRISKASAAYRVMGFSGYGGDQIGENVIQFVKGNNNKIFIKRISYREISRDSSDNGMYKSLQNSSFQPIVASFDIKAQSPDSLASIIDVTEYLGNDNDVLFFHPGAKRMYALGTLQPDKSYIQKVSTFPLNMEIRTVKTYYSSDYGNSISGELFNTYEINSSLVLLPSNKMKIREADERVGYFTADYVDFDRPQGAKPASMVTRWRMEPRPEDVIKYMNGELVEPNHPIIFYIDPATPEKWVPYLIQGVNDWQKAFEKAGFKRAIYALKAPKNDSTWSLDDARHNAIVYKASSTANATGPHVHDPRTGEILETHINWYHNVMQLLHDWYMVQASLSDSNARRMQFDEKLMGRLIRFACAHEVGHTLGLLHNFGASSTVPVEKLRDKKYVDVNGISPSIMDYARFNYVAQPEDSISGESLIGRIGIYDEWAIEWAYRWFPGFESDEEEKTYLTKWIIARTGNDRRLYYGSQTNAINDPKCQAEDLGDDPIKAGEYGIKNLKRLIPKLKEWTKEPNSGYEALGRMENQAVQQFERYMWLVEKNIAGVCYEPKTIEEKSAPISFISKEKQKSALKFLKDQLFITPEWILPKERFLFIGGGAGFELLKAQENIIHDLLIAQKFNLLFWSQTTDPKNCYPPEEYLNDVKNMFWDELKANKPIDLYRRNIQKAYVHQLIQLLKEGEGELRGSNFTRYLDGFSLVKAQLRTLIKEIDKSLLGYKDELTKSHLLDIKQKLQKTLDPTAILSTDSGGRENGLNSSINLNKTLGNINQNRFYCWENYGWGNYFE